MIRFRMFRPREVKAMRERLRHGRQYPVGLAMAVCAMRALTAAAQSGPTLTGVVVAADSSPLAGAVISATDSASGALVLARTGTTGEYKVRVAAGGHTYQLTATMIGYAPSRRIIHMVEGETTRRESFVLRPAAVSLTGFNVVAQRPKTPRTAGRDNSVGAAVSSISLSSGLTGDLSGDATQAALASATVTLTPSADGSAPSITAFGVTADQNTTTLDNLPFSGSVPREGFTLGLVSSTYDPTHGGFAGVQTSLHMQPGSNVVTRIGHVTFDTPGLQWTPVGSSAFGGTYQSIIGSAAASGPLLEDRVFYATSVQASNRSSNLHDVFSFDPGTLRQLSVSPDTLARLREVSRAIGLAESQSSATRSANELRVAARIDWMPTLPPPRPDGGQSTPFFDDYYVQAGGSTSNTGGIVNSPFVTRSASSTRSHRDLWSQLTAARYLPKNILNETTISVAGSDDKSGPSASLPAALLAISSDTDSQAPITVFNLGGGGTPQLDSKTWSAGLRDQLSWSSWSRKHSITLLTEARSDGFALSQSSTPGEFSYTSIADFAANQPAAYSRAIDGERVGTHEQNLVAAIGDVYVPRLPSASSSPVWMVQYGIRVEASRFGQGAGRSPLADSLFGVHTGKLPNPVAVTPMVGFDVPLLAHFVASNGDDYGPRARLTGGIREYRGTLAVRSVAPYLQQTGGASSSQELFCVGDGAPRPDWPAIEAGGAAPLTCSTGSGVGSLVQSAPSVSSYAPGFQMFESWRPSVTFNDRLSDQVSASIGETGVLNTHVTSFVDRNFDRVPKFYLADEEGRPVYAPSASIAPTTGVVAWGGSRLVSSFGHVNETRSDMSGVANTLSAGMTFAPLLKTLPRYATLNLQYAWTRGEQRARGFSASTPGDPDGVERGRIAQPEHAVTVSVQAVDSRLGTVTAFARAQSGLRYTPMVSGDINGDGYANDRAFVFAPEKVEDTLLADGMSNLLAHAPSGARACLVRQLGTIAARNSCLGPWAITNIAVQIEPEPYRIGLGNRGKATIYVNNALVAVDQLLHGAGHLHGWGQYALPDQTLLNVRGYNPTEQRFDYSVNSLFGRVSSARQGVINPFAITLDIRLDVGPDRQTQYLNQLLHPRRSEGLAFYDEEQIRNRIAGRGSVLDAFMSVRDSLGLTANQVSRLRDAWQTYTAIRDTAVTALSKFLAERRGDFGGEQVRTRWHASAVELYAAYVAALRGMVDQLTPQQRTRSTTLGPTSGLIFELDGIRDVDLRWMLHGPIQALP